LQNIRQVRLLRLCQDNFKTSCLKRIPEIIQIIRIQLKLKLWADVVLLLLDFSSPKWRPEWKGTDVLEKQVRLYFWATFPSIENDQSHCWTKSCYWAIYAPTCCLSQLRHYGPNCNRSSCESSPNKCDFNMEKLAAETDYYISIMLYLSYGALFYSFLTSISSFIKFSCEFQLRVGLWFNVNAYT